MKITKRQLRRIIKEEKLKLVEGMPDLRDTGGPMLDLGVALEDAIAKAQIATGSSKGYQKELASEIQLELEGLLEMMWEL